MLNAEVIEEQREYINKVKDLNSDSQRYYNILTMGCQLNENDSEKIAGMLTEMGYRETDDLECASIFILNTCCVRENAEEKLFGKLGELKKLKQKNNSIIAICGCMMQEATVVEKLQKSYRFVDLIFGTHNIFKFAELLAMTLESDRMIIDIWKDTDKIVEDLPVERKYSFKSGVNIMFGCNNFCSYCIVPYVRGRERSREPKEIIREIERLAADGVVEIMLLGQNVNSYGKNLDTPVTFAQLLQEVEKIEGQDVPIAYDGEMQYEGIKERKIVKSYLATVTYIGTLEKEEIESITFNIKYKEMPQEDIEEKTNYTPIVVATAGTGILVISGIFLWKRKKKDKIAQ